MSRMNSDQSLYDVAIAGFGPTGAVLAGLLGRMGRRVLVIEREPEVYTLPRAVHFDDEVMRIFQSLGLVEEILPLTRAALKCEFWSKDREVLMVLPMDIESTAQGWASDYMFHQPSLERTLRDSAEARPGVGVWYGKLNEFREAEDQVELTITMPDGARQSACARYLVGCDGAAGELRKRSNFALEDLEFDEPWVVVDVRGAEGLPEVIVQYCDPARPTTLVPCAMGYNRFEFMLRPDEPPEDVVRPEALNEMLSAWLDPEKTEIVRAAVYRFHAIVAREWWRGRVQDRRRHGPRLHASRRGRQEAEAERSCARSPARHRSTHRDRRSNVRHRGELRALAFVA